MTATLDAPPAPARARGRITLRPGGWFVWAAVIFFVLIVAGVVFAVLVDSFATRWFGGWLPEGWTTHWYGATWHEFALADVLLVTLEVAVAVVVVSLAIGVPAAYALARRTFWGKRALMVIFLLPILIPPFTYGVPLATVLYKFHLAGTLTGVILANLVPAVPFVILVMTPFIEQIDPKIESAARMCGAGTGPMFLRILAPLLIPGMLASAVLILVRTVGMFELTFLTAGPDSQTLVVALYYSVSAAGIRAQQEVDAMAVIYTGSMLALLIIALKFVNPTQLVTRLGD